jgi:chromosome segregation ATPase
VSRAASASGMTAGTSGEKKAGDIPAPVTPDRVGGARVDGRRTNAGRQSGHPTENSEFEQEHAFNVEDMHRVLERAMADQVRIEQACRSLVKQEESRLELTYAKPLEVERQPEHLQHELDDEREDAAELRHSGGGALANLRDLQARYNELCDTLVEAQTRAAERAAHAAHAENELTQERARSAELLRQVMAGGSRVGELEQTAEVLRSALVEARADPTGTELSELRAKLVTVETRLLGFQKALAEAEVELFSKRHELAELQMRFSRKLQRAMELEDDHAALSHQHATTVDHLAQVSASLTQEQLCGERFTKRIAHLEGDLAQLKAECDASKEKVSQISVSLVEQTELVQELRRQLAEAAQSNELEIQKKSDLEREIDTRRREYNGIHQRTKRTELQLTELSSALAAARETIVRRELELEAMRRNWSWRLGAPFRGISRGLSRFRRAILRWQWMNPLFDCTYYLEQCPDVRASGFDPFAHYLRFGATEGRNPNPMFDTDWYLQRYPDVRDSGMNPLRHFFLYGATEGRDPHPLFSTAWYLEQHPEVRGRGVNVLEHYLRSRKFVGDASGLTLRGQSGCPS